MDTNLTKTYEPIEIEKEIYTWWESEGYFKPESQIQHGLAKNSPKFCLTLPPPNVTGSLHLGHALTISLEDFMTRYERMHGKETLFLPGSDHAGIATQNVVERELRKQGLKRKELGREKFIEKVWEWKKQYHARITEQSKRMGISSDWSRERFTLDDNLSQSVRLAFVTLYKKGLIYRGNYLINWCPGRCESAISDLEAIPEETKGFLWYIRYPVVTKKWQAPQNIWGSGSWAKGADQFIEVATTRPETLLGDTAIATTAEHPKFGKLIGKKVIVPAIGRIISIITDPLVDPHFGTGAVKVTPAHDPNDYEMGNRHKLDFITVIDQTGRMLPEYAGKYANADRFECRNALVADLEKEGLLVKIEPYTYSINHCERCDTIIEPRISTQWFVKTKPLAEVAIEKVRNKQVTIIPEREEKRFFQWMENIRDWCISRQLWWGHQIPIWYCECGEQICAMESPTSCPKCNKTNLKQDDDVLDTWFSSGLWPASTLGWGWNESSYDFKRFYSTDMRETGYDILFFWVARELMMCIELTGKVPYKTVYLHGIVRNEQGKKISKSMENIKEYDPLNIIEKYGADSLRYTLITNSTPGLDINMDIRRIEGARRFCNKIWQSTRYVLGNITENDAITRFEKNNFANLNLADKWILSRLNRLIRNVLTYIENYQYLEAGRDINNFYWNEFCDWYIEITKFRIYAVNADKITPLTLLLHVISTSLKLLHPFLPHLTEKLWQALPVNIRDSEAIIFASYPVPDIPLINDDIEKKFGLIMNIIRSIRSVRGDFGIDASKELVVDIYTENDTTLANIKTMYEEIIPLAKIDPKKITFSTKITKTYTKTVKLDIEDVIVYVPLEGLIDFSQEYDRTNKELVKLNKEIERLEKKLSSEFGQKASKKAIEIEQQRLNETKVKKTEFEKKLLLLEE